MCRSPSIPPRSMNAPNSAIFVTVPLTMSPSLTLVKRLRRASSRSTSINLRRLMTMLRRSRSIFSTAARIVRPTKSPTSPGRRTSTCDAGKKTGTPMSTRSPPLILRRTFPSTTSPSFFDCSNNSQPRMRSALRFERTMFPS